MFVKLYLLIKVYLLNGILFNPFLFGLDKEFIKRYIRQQ